MAENSPVRRVRPSPRKQPYENPIKAPALPALTGRAPLRNIQSAITAPLQNKKMGANFSKKMEVDASVPVPVPPPENKKPEFGVIGENRLRRENSLGFIPVDKSCIIGGDEMHASANNSLNLSSSSSMDPDGGATGWNPFSSFHVTSGILGALQPRGLNTSFTEKFESRLGINTKPILKENDENEGVQQKPHILSSQPRGILTQRFIPLFDFPLYSDEILKYWGDLEKKFKIKWDYMERHESISYKMRTILIDWLVEVVNEYDLTEEALHLAVNYLDRFLCRMNVKRSKLQLVGTAALFVAAKFEETHPPEIADFVYVTDEAYTKREILAMERCMLTVLEFDLMMPTANYFASSYCSILQLSDPIKCLAMYLVDLSLMDGETFLKFLPSVVAGAAVALGRYIFDKNYWDAKLQGICQHRKKTITPCARELHKVFFEASARPQTSIYEKYQTVRYCSVANMFIPNNGPWDEEQVVSK